MNFAGKISFFYLVLSLASWSLLKLPYESLGTTFVPLGCIMCTVYDLVFLFGFDFG